MKFRKIKRRKIYETWVTKYRKSTIYVLKHPKLKLYHFQIFNCKIIYASIEYGITFDNLKECCEIAWNKLIEFCNKCNLCK